MIYINGRFLTQTLTGSQRFAYEMAKSIVLHYPDNVTILVPPTDIKPNYIIDKNVIKVIGTRSGLVWEQIDLPLYMSKTNKQLLINLVNTAPIALKHQIISIMDMTTFVNPKWFSKAFAFYYKIIVPIIARRSLKVLTISESSKHDILKYINILPEKVEILYCSVSDNFLSSAKVASNDEATLKKFNLEKDKYLLAVSSLDPRKNFVALVKAYKNAKTSIPLIIVGSEGKVFANSELKEIISSSKNIILTGYVSEEELVTLYSNATCFLYPSLYEGFGMPPLEAMACGCATIVSDTSSLPEVCGDGSLYVNPLDIPSITKAIITVINDVNLRKELISKGKKQVGKFSWQRSGIILKNVIDNLQK
ncbi:glycosyltransferase family 4 protein [Mucilaginibacter terrae]|uniref:glycosyltransferase family 4 protein n=1 Tax=Mucilaginibacter terrae TaxID=1955052 RepID=UPI00362F648C